MKDFYPRSPRGERRWVLRLHHRAVDISIHAPREGSDITGQLLDYYPTHFYPRSPRGERPRKLPVMGRKRVISIHAPREGSDSLWNWCTSLQGNFYPRSPRGERRAMSMSKTYADIFLSTLPVRGATPCGDTSVVPDCYFYPRSP